MKNMKRSERRHQAKTKFERRIKVWASGESVQAKEEIRKGKSLKFLHHTSTPCSCKGMCAYLKYERTPKWKWKILKRTIIE